MAYNPFDFFRRNQKTAFAALTVFVMFTFVLSFGQGDFFQWLPGWLGSFKNRGKEVMATIDGRKIYDADLYKYDDDRALADEFMKQLLGTIINQKAESLREDVKGASKEAKPVLEEFLRRRPGYLDPLELQFMAMQNPNLTQAQIENTRQSNRQRVQISILQLQFKPDATTGDKELIESAQQLMQLDNQASQVSQTGNYFWLPGRAKTNEDRLEYELWLRKADKIGIAIRPEDSPAHVKEDLGPGVTPEVWATVEKGFGSKINFSRARLLAALADEFKVRSAVDIVLGKDYLAGRVRVPTTPFDTYQFFKDQTDAATYVAMSVPSENFLDKVKETPTESDLRNLFDKYKGVEPAPDRELPGFREPRKLKIAWLEVRGDEPFYVRQADEVGRLGEAGVRLAGLGFGSTAPVSSALTSTLADPALQAAYAGYRVRFEDSIRNKWYPFRPTTDEIIDSSVVRPQNVGAALVTLVGSGLTKGSPLTAGLIVKERANQFERQDRARVLAAMLSPATPAGSNLLGNVLVAGAAMPTPPPLAVVRNDLVDGVKGDLARARAEQDVREFAIELARLGQKKDKSDARSHADKFLRERGLKTGGSTEFRDQYTLDDDPGLAVLADKKDRGHGMIDVPMRYGPRLFVPTDRRSGAPVLTYYEPIPFPLPDQSGFGSTLSIRPNEPSYMIWRTETIEPQTPRELKDARAKVEAAWKLAKARELAKAAAEDLRKRIDQKVKEEKAEDARGKLDLIVRDVHGQFHLDTYGNGADSFDKRLRAKFFFIDKVAPIRVERAPFDVRGMDEQPMPFQPFHLQKKDLQYPSVAMYNALLENKGKTLGTTVLEPDRAKDIFYVFTLIDRDRQGQEEFRLKGIAEGRTPLAGAVRNLERGTALRKTRETAIALLKAEFKVAGESEKLKEKASASGE
jgi:hypothetical protein